jgi:hypothetical protein
MVIVGIMALHVASQVLSPPARYPDLFAALFALYGSILFIGVYVYLVFSLWFLKDLKLDP